MFINTIRLADSNEIQISRQKDLFPCNETIETFISNEMKYKIYMFRKDIIMRGIINNLIEFAHK